MASNHHTTPSWMADVKEDTIKTNVILNKAVKLKLY